MKREWSLFEAIFGSDKSKANFDQGVFTTDRGYTDPAIFSDQQLRRQALDMATRMPDQLNTAACLARAQAFYGFLRGEGK